MSCHILDICRSMFLFWKQTTEKVIFFELFWVFLKFWQYLHKLLSESEMDKSETIMYLRLYYLNQLVNIYLFISPTRNNHFKRSFKVYWHYKHGDVCNGVKYSTILYYGVHINKVNHAHIAQINQSIKYSVCL